MLKLNLRPWRPPTSCGCHKVQGPQALGFPRLLRELQRSTRDLSLCSCSSVGSTVARGLRQNSSMHRAPGSPGTGLVERSDEHGVPQHGQSHIHESHCARTQDQPQVASMEWYEEAMCTAVHCVVYAECICGVHFRSRKA